MQRNNNTLKQIEAIAAKIQELLPEQHPHKHNFALYYRFICQENYDLIDAIITKKPDQAILFLLIAAEVGSLNVCKHLATKHKTAVSRETPGTNLLFAIVCCDKEERKNLLEWLYHDFEKLTIWKPFTDSHILAALGPEEFEGFIDGTHVLYDASEDNLGITPKDYFFASGHYYSKHVNPEITTEDIARYMQGPLPLSGLGDFLQSNNQKEIADAKGSKSAKTTAKNLDYNYRPKPTEPTLAWSIAYHSTFTYEISSALVGCLMMSDHTIDLAATFSPPSSTRRQATYQNYCTLIVRNQTERVRHAKKLGTNNVSVLTALFVSREYPVISALLRKNPHFNFNVHALLVPDNPALGTYGNFLKQQPLDTDIINFYRSLSNHLPDKFISILEVLDYATNLTVFKLMCAVLAPNKKFELLRKLVKAAQELNAKKYMSPRDKASDNTTLYRCILTQLLDSNAPNDIILNAIDYLEFEEMFADDEPVALDELKYELSIIEDQSLVIAIHKRYPLLESLLKSDAKKTSETIPVRTSNQQDLVNLGSVEKNRAAKNLLPDNDIFKTDLDISLEFIDKNDIAAINSQVRNGTHTALDYLFLAAETGNLVVVRLISFNYQAALSTETPGRNLLLAVTHCSNNAARKRLLEWMLENYNNLPVRKYFTENHIKAALGCNNTIDDSVDNLGLSCLEYYIASGHLLSKNIDEEIIAIDTKFFSHYLHNQLRLTSLGRYFEKTKSKQSKIDWNYRRTPTDRTLAWYIAYYDTCGFDITGVIMGLMACDNQKIDLKATGSFAATRKLTYTDYISICMKRESVITKMCCGDLGTLDLDVWRQLLLTRRFTAIEMILESNRDFDLDLTAPIITKDAASKQFSSTIAQYIIANSTVLSFFKKICTLWPAQTLTFCIAFGFMQDPEVRLLLTIGLLSLGRNQELIALLNSDNNNELSYDLNFMIALPKNPLRQISFGIALLEMNTPVEVLERIISRMQKRYDYDGNHPENDFVARIQKNTQLYALLQKVYEKLPPLLARQTSRPQPNQNIVAAQPVKAKAIAKPSFSTPTPASTKQNITPEEELNKKLESYFGNNYTKNKKGEIVIITVTGNYEFIKRISDATKKLEASACKIDRNQINKGILIFTGKLKPVNEYFKNGAVSSLLLSARQVENKDANNDKNKSTFVTTARTRTPLDLDPESKDETIKTLHKDIKKTLHHAFCDAEQVSVSWNSEKKCFVLTVDDEQRTWIIKANGLRHTKRYAVTCKPDSIETLIIQRVTKRLDELTDDLSYTRQGMQFFITFYIPQVPELAELNQQVQTEFLRWDARIVTTSKSNHDVTLFAKAPAQVPLDEPVNGTPDIHFRCLFRMITESTQDSFESFKLERVIEEDLKYELHCHYKLESLQKLRAVANTINKHLNKSKDCVFIHDTNPTISIFIHATAKELHSLNNMQKLREDYQTALQAEITVENEKKSTSIIITAPTAASVEITPAAIKPDETKILSPAEQKQAIIARDKETLKRVVQKISEKENTVIVENLYIHLETLNAIHAANQKNEKSAYFYAYLFHATRLFVILAHLSFDTNNPNNLFYDWRVVLRHAHFEENTDDLHLKISYITSLLKLQLELYFPNVKIVKNATLTDAHCAQMRDMLTEYTKKAPKKYLPKLQKKFLEIQKDKSADSWQMDAEIMLQSLIEKYTPNSKRYIFKQLGHNNVYDVEPMAEVLKRNLHMKFHEFLQQLHGQIRLDSPVETLLLN